MRPAILALLVTAVLVYVPFTIASADTAFGAELVVNGYAESGTESNPIPGWLDETYAGRWSSMGTFSDWPPPPEGSRFFFLYNPSMESLSGDMSQWITLSGTEGGGLFAGISAGNVSMHFTLSMYQKINAGNEVKGIVEQYSAGGTLLGNLQPRQYDRRDRHVRRVLAQYPAEREHAEIQGDHARGLDSGRLRAVRQDQPEAGGRVLRQRARVRKRFPGLRHDQRGTAYTHGFTITDADSGDVDRLVFTANSTNVDLVPVANVAVTGTGTSRTLTITPVSGLSGEADVTITASDGVKSADATLHLVVSKVISLGTNLVENGNATSGFASWVGSNVNITATGNGFAMVSPGIGMSQDLDVSKYSAFIDGGASEYPMSAGFPDTYGKVYAQCYSDIACTSPVGSAFEVNGSTTSRTGTLPATPRASVDVPEHVGRLQLGHHPQHQLHPPQQLSEDDRDRRPDDETHGADRACARVLHHGERDADRGFERPDRRGERRNRGERDRI